jgi:hypothetical protein
MAKGKGGSNDSRKLSFGKKKVGKLNLDQKNKNQKSIEDKEDNVYRKRNITN